MHTPAIAIAHSDSEYSKQLFEQLRLRAHFMDFRLANGLEALNYLINHQPEIMILEEELPILSAMDLIKMANYKSLNTQFIVISHKSLLPDYSDWFFTDRPMVIHHKENIDIISATISHCEKVFNAS